jgi:hypothetical protein
MKGTPRTRSREKKVQSSGEKYEAGPKIKSQSHLKNEQPMQMVGG